MRTLHEAVFAWKRNPLVRLNVEKQIKTTLTINAQAAIEDPNFSEPTPSGTRESKRAGSRPSLETGTKWFEIKRRNNRQIDGEPSG